MNRINVFLEGRDRWNPVKSLTTLTGQVAHEYEDRFLVELLQNAYDAHAPGFTGGRVWIVLDAVPGRGSECGILYVANSGRPFGWKNFDALSNIAHSSKPPGEGIGNKGLGFRSVLQVCDWPEVYSADPDDPSDESFSGYCFGFADDADLERLPLSEQEVALVKAEFSRYLLPVRRTPGDAVLHRLRDAGAVSVIRLPMKSQKGLQTAREQLEKLRNSATPVMLFLDRIESLTLEVLDEGDVRTVHLETREQQPVQLNALASSDGTRAFQVTTAGQTFLVGHRSVPEHSIRAVVQGSVDAQQLDESWLRWEGDGEVAVAVPLADEPASEKPGPASRFATYTFLPMDVDSPLGGHLSAPFYTKLARIDLNEDVGLNTFLFDVAADVACDLALALRQEPQILADHGSRAIVDLVTWDRLHADRMTRAFQRRELDIRAYPWVPASDANKSFVALEFARLWSDGFTQLTPAALVDAGVDVVDTTIGSRREERLAALWDSTSVAGDIIPDDDKVAHWTELVAAAMHVRGAGGRAWRELYADLLAYFGDVGRARALQGKRILLAQDGRLRRAGPWDEGRVTRDPTVFLPPRRAAEEQDELADDVATNDDEFKIPKRLQRAVAFLHEEVAAGEEGVASSRRVRNPIVDMMEDARLVERFDRHAMFRHVRRMLAGQVGESTRMEALRWVYLQHRSARQGLRGLAQLNLSVPTRSGWIPAAEAFFSGGWPVAPAHLERLVSQEAARSPWLKWVNDSMLLAPDQWPFSIEDLASFQEFLAQIGVRNGLWPMSLHHDPIEQDGLLYAPDAVALSFGLSEPARSEWIADVNSRWGGYREFKHPYTPYRSDSNLWVLPGQDCYAGMDDAAKRWFATLLAANAGAWDESVWQFAFRRERLNHRRTPDPQVWPSPLASFVDRATWFPMTELGNRDSPTFVALGQGWLFTEDEGERAPRFARMPPHDVRRALESRPSRTLLTGRGLRVWNDNSSAEGRLRELASLLDSGFVTASERAPFRHACEAAWTDLASSDGTHDLSDLPLVVSRGHDFSVVQPAGTAPASQVLLPRSGTSLGAEVLESLEQDVLVCDPTTSDAIEGLLSERPDLELRPLDDVEVQIFADGEEIVPSDGHPLLLDTAGEWLTGVVALAVSLQTSPFRRITEKTVHDSLTALRRVRVVFATSLGLRLDGQPLAASDSGGHLRIDDPDAPVLLVISETGSMSWNALDAMSDGIASLVGEAGAAVVLRAAALALARATADRWIEPGLSELAAAFRVSTNRAADVLAGLRGAVDQMVHALLPALASLTDQEFALSLEAADCPDADAMARLLATRLQSGQVERIMRCLEAGQEGDALRTALGIPLGDFNAALQALGRTPIHFVGEHEAAFAHYLNVHRAWLSRVVRNSYVTKFFAVEDLSRYAELRHLPGLFSDPDWLTAHESPPPDLMRERCEVWLRENDIGTPASSTGSGRVLPDLDQVREANQLFLDRCLSRLAALVAAWHRSRGLDDEFPSPTTTRERLMDCGCLDFEPLTEGTLLPWLVRLGIWPRGMPKRLDPAGCELGWEDFAADELPHHGGGRPMRDPKKTIGLGTRQFSVELDRLRELAEFARASVDERLLETGRRLARLNELPLRVSRGGGSGRGDNMGRYPSEKQMSSEQKRAIGLIGEVLAFEWLKHTYHEVNQDSWVSGYRSFTIGGYEGDDQRGFDFEVKQASRVLQYEVKATSGDDFSFELGASELRAARTARAGTYRIIFIQNVLDTESRRLMILPNPLESGVADRFRQANSGIRFTFEPAGS